ncbi:MAG: FMN-binding protein, partial [Spirochaetota bacterium]|nr:FMN-binding protein [Spirochaetota bacterium]
AEWNGANVNSGYDKVYQSENGMYGMVENGGAQAPWFEQAAKVEAALIEAQDPSAISYDSDGYTDAISGVSIHINEFIELAEEALAQGPVSRGPYKDGYYHAELDAFNNGWKDYVDVTVIGGYIVAVHWSAYPEEGELDKYRFSKEGQYGMVENGGAQDPWWVQVDRAEAYLLETQDPAQIEYVDEDGHVDAISGVSIHVKELFSLAEKALAEAK